MPSANSGNALLSLSSAPSLDTSRPWAPPSSIWDPTGPQELVLTTLRHTVTGGQGTLTVTDTAGSNTINGGAGGLNATVTGTYGLVTTASGSSNKITVANRTTVQGAGNDVIKVTGGCNAVRSPETP